MEGESLDERYLMWLYGQVADVRIKARTRSHLSLMRQFHKTIFVAIVSHDENRIADAQDLRYEFLAQHEGEQGDPDWTRSPCSMFELLVILSRALAFEMDDAADIWFWHLVEVLGLKKYNDHAYDERAREVVTRTLDRVIWRTYSPDGTGGLFPLHDPPRDQRQVELWYQLNAYLLEQF
jgi:hypothetical protein